ncbi:hypothetical protein L249_2815, partial [Ophiocordyceps polyrhachis-furcata BCC 54312]
CFAWFFCCAYDRKTDFYCGQEKKVDDRCFLFTLDPKPAGVGLSRTKEDDSAEREGERGWDRRHGPPWIWIFIACRRDETMTDERKEINDMGRQEKTRRPRQLNSGIVVTPKKKKKKSIGQLPYPRPSSLALFFFVFFSSLRPALSPADPALARCRAVAGWPSTHSGFVSRPAP